mmetsp:Transcript_30034/g.75582  ORF Transcript_30034/g.75582 Transcript_30034/m.75582 type:complete len:378 (-) Transcript_30034:26-1159(-)
MSAGRIHVELAYERPTPEEKGCLRVFIVEARDVPPKDKNGMSDPFVKIRIGKRKPKKTKVQQKTLNPIFEEMFEIDVSDVDAGSDVILSMYDWDRVGKNDFIGEARIPLHVIPKEPTPYWFDLATSKVILPSLGNNSPRGSMSTPTQGSEPPTRSTTWSLLKHTEQPEESANFSYAGSLRLRLSYSETENTLSVTVVSARDLLAKDKNGLSDPYVLLQLGKQQKKTRVVKKTLNPIFDQTLTLFAVRDSFLSASVWDWDRVGKDFIGAINPIPVNKLTRKGVFDSDFPLNSLDKGRDLHQSSLTGSQILVTSPQDIQEFQATARWRRERMKARHHAFAEKERKMFLAKKTKFKPRSRIKGLFIVALVLFLFLLFSCM